MDLPDPQHVSFALRFGPVLVVIGALAAGGAANAQNDWQFPDPYFGVVEFGKSRLPGGDARYRAEISPAPKPVIRPRPPRRGYRAERVRRVAR